MVIIHDVQQGTKEWHKLRKDLYTASEAGKLLKQGKFQKETSNFKGNFYTRRGQELEPEALELYHTIKSSTSLPHGFVTNDKYPSAGASPDDLTETTYVEVKCFGEKKHLECSKAPIFDVIAQIQFGLMVTEYKEADLVLYNPDIEDSSKCLFIIPIKADKVIHGNFIKILNK